MKKNKVPKPRYVTAKAIKELKEQYNYPYEEWMQDWPYEIVNTNDIGIYLAHYKEQTDEDKKIVIMQMLIQALEEVKDKSRFFDYLKIIKSILIKDFNIHQYTIFYWCCFNNSLEDSWMITPYLRQLWDEKVK